MNQAFYFHRIANPHIILSFKASTFLFDCTNAALCVHKDSFGLNFFIFHCTCFELKRFKKPCCLFPRSFSAILASPLAAVASRLPLVVMLHGGPQFTAGFHPLANAALMSDMAVLMINYRGSTGTRNEGSIENLKDVSFSA